MNNQDAIESERMRSMIFDSIVFGGVGTMIGFSASTLLKMDTTRKIIFSVVGLSAGLVICFYLKSQKNEVKGTGDVSPEAKKNRDIKFTKV